VQLTPGKTYFVSASQNGKCFHVPHVSNEQQEQHGKATELVLWDCDHEKNQELTLLSSPSHKEAFKIHSSFGKCLEVESGRLENGKKLIWVDCQDIKSQDFKFPIIGNAYEIQTEGGQCINVEGWKKEKETSLRLSECTQEVSAKFILSEVEPVKNHEEKPLVISFQNKEDDVHTKNLKASLEYWKWDYLVIGAGAKWLGFGTKLRGYIEKLKSLTNRDRIVVLSDATDVIVNHSPEVFLKNYLRISQWNGQHRIVSSSEIGCCVHAFFNHCPGSFLVSDGTRKDRALPTDKNELHHEGKWMDEMLNVKRVEGYGKQEDNASYNYLNSGMIVGRAKDLLTMFEYLKFDENEDDQALITEYFFQFPERIQLDYSNVLFSNANFREEGDGCFFNWDDKGNYHANTRTETVPGFIQTPGKYWACYCRLLKSVKSKNLFPVQSPECQDVI
jgi:hypothetical protein